MRRNDTVGRRTPAHAAWLACAAVLTLGPPARAQDKPTAPAAAAPAIGSITITSQPTGANVRLEGGQIITGHTPLTIARGLVGPFGVEVWGPRYETWKRHIFLDGASSDSVFARLSPKHIWWAGLRSAVMPGWGQFYSERKPAGWTYISLAAASGSVLVAYQVKYRGRVRQADASYEDLQSATTPADIAAAQADYDTRVIRVDEAKHQRNVAAYVFGTVWAVNFVDAVFFFRGPRPGGLTVAGVVQPESDGVAASLALHTSF